MSSYEARPEGAPVLVADAAGAKDIGGREHDEDGILVRTDLCLFAVADGAGGENGGNVASSLALVSLARHYEATQKAARTMPGFDLLGIPREARRLSAGVQLANKEVLEIARTSHKYRGMGTTIVAVAPDLMRSVIHVAHVGDSRCYRLRVGRLELITQDHSLAQDVLELSPEIDDVTATKLPQNVITRALGMSETVRVSVRSLDLAIGDRFLLCSDGLTDVLSDEQIAEILLTIGGVQDQAPALIERAKAASADDNIAAVVVHVEAAVGVTAFPKRHATRALPTRPPSAPPRGQPGDSWGDPEIIIVDSDLPGPSDPVMHMIPHDARPESMTALHRVVIPRPRPRARPGTEPGIERAASEPGASEGVSGVGGSEPPSIEVEPIGASRQLAPSPPSSPAIGHDVEPAASEPLGAEGGTETTSDAASTTPGDGSTDRG
jgi:serine/threonine protein phosphatase PrpC